MTKADRKELKRYVRWLANELGLRDWTINLHYGDTDDERSFAETTTTFGRKIGDISLCEDFRELEPVVQRHTLIHELLHCVFAQEQEFIRSDVKHHLGLPVWNVFFAAYTSMHEYAIDGVTDAIQTKYPLIAWPKTGGGKKK